MNNSRRKRINESISLLEGAQVNLTSVLKEEQNALSSLPDDEEYDDMRNGMDDIISGLEDTLSSLTDTLDTLYGQDF